VSAPEKAPTRRCCHGEKEMKYAAITIGVSAVCAAAASVLTLVFERKRQKEKIDEQYLAAFLGAVSPKKL
jgi:hypothetical protein